MRKRLALFLTLSWVMASVSQNKEKSIFTVDENATWITELKKEGLETRLEKLRERFSDDQRIYYVSTRNPHGSDRIEEGFEEITYTRPLYIIRSRSGEPFILPDNPSAGLVEELNRVLTTERVSSISFKEGIKMNALYGSRARFGVIEINLSDEESLENLKKNSRS